MVLKFILRDRSQYMQRVVKYSVLSTGLFFWMKGLQGGRQLAKMISITLALGMWFNFE